MKGFLRWLLFSFLYERVFCLNCGKKLHLDHYNQWVHGIGEHSTCDPNSTKAYFSSPSKTIMGKLGNKTEPDYLDKVNNASSNNPKTFA